MAPNSPYRISGARSQTNFYFKLAFVHTIIAQHQPLEKTLVEDTQGLKEVPGAAAAIILIVDQ